MVKSNFHQEKPILSDMERTKLKELSIKSNGGNIKLYRLQLPDVVTFQNDLKLAFGSAIDKKSDKSGTYQETPEYHQVVYDAIQPLMTKIQETIFHSFPVRIRKIWYENIWESDTRSYQKVSHNLHAGWTCAIYANHNQSLNTTIKLFPETNSALDYAVVSGYESHDVKSGDVFIFPSTWRCSQDPNFCDKKHAQLMIFIDFWGFD